MFQNFEVLVIGDSCTDGSEVEVKKLRDHRFTWRNLAVNSGGQWGPNNEGIQEACGRYIAFLGHDDLWFPWHLERLVGHIEMTGADLVYSLSAVIRPEKQMQISGPPSFGRSFGSAWIAPSSWLLKTSVAREVGPWKPSSVLMMASDIEYLERIHNAKKQIVDAEDLTVLKFPSADWGLYSRTKDHPQIYYWQKLLLHPQSLYNSILRNAAAELARQSAPIVPVMRLVRQIAHTVLYNLVNLYGRARWPLNLLFRWRLRRIVRRRRVKRGLNAP